MSCPLRAYPVKAATDSTVRLYVMGHPNGAELSVTLNDNLLTEADARHLWYRSPTEAGSSGSPIGIAITSKHSAIALIGPSTAAAPQKVRRPCPSGKPAPAADRCG